MKITIAYDGRLPHYEWIQTDILEACRQFDRIKDWGFADEYATVNLLLDNGKMYTKIFYRKDRIVVER
jgi:hypothetical protein